MSGASEQEGGFYGRLTRGAPLAVLVAAVLLVLYEALPVLELVAIAMLLALVLRTAVRGLGRLGAPGWLSVVVLLGAIAAFGALVWFVVVPNVLREVRVLTSSGPGSLAAVADLLQDLPVVPESAQIVERVKDYLSQLLGSLPSLVYTAATAIGATVAVIFLALYCAVDPDRYVSGLMRIVPRGHREMVNEFIYRLGERLRGWIVGTILIAAFVGTAGGVGLWLLDVPLPLTFGILAGLLNVIPYAGSIVGGALPALVALTISPVKAIEVVALFVAINQIEGNVLQPKIMGREIEVPEATILVAFLMLGVLLGPIIGAVLAVPTAVLVGVIVDELTERQPSLGDGDAEKREGRGEKKR